MSDYAWMELCEVSMPTLQDLKAQSLDAICLQLPSLHPELTTLILQVVPSKQVPNDHIMFIHPLLYEFLIKAAEMEAFERHEPHVSTGVLFSIAPLPGKEYANFQDTFEANPERWTATRVKDIVDLPTSSPCLYKLYVS